jgi:predicted amidohydrolase YtcJ
VRSTRITNPKTTILRTIEPGNINHGIIRPRITTREALLGMMTRDGTMFPKTMKREGTIEGGKRAGVSDAETQTIKRLL